MQFAAPEHLSKESVGRLSTIKTGGWSASSSRFPMTRSALRPSGITSPSDQFGTAVANVGGSAGAPSTVSS
jgi:hypothetical protein